MHILFIDDVKKISMGPKKGWMMCFTTKMNNITHTKLSIQVLTWVLYVDGRMEGLSYHEKGLATYHVHFG